MLKNFFLNWKNLINYIFDIKNYRDYWFLREFLINKDTNIFSKEFKKILKIIIEDLFWLKARFTYYLNNWIYTTNHKRIAVNYFLFVILSGCVGMILATLIRLEMAYPGVGVMAGDSIQYLSMVTAHAVVMVFFMIVPLIFGAFANFLLPTQMGVHDVAFPRMNSAAFWFLPGGLLLLAQLVCVDRRYQRMNCFNVKEVESLLKRKFFYDLVTHNDNHKFINETSIGLRYKTNNLNLIDPNYNIISNYGLNLLFKFRKFYSINKLNDLNLDYKIKNNFLVNLVDYFYLKNWLLPIYLYLDLIIHMIYNVFNNNFYYLFYFNKYNIISNTVLNFNFNSTTGVNFNFIFSYFEFIKELLFYNFFIIFITNDIAMFKNFFDFNFYNFSILINELDISNIIKNFKLNLNFWFLNFDFYFLINFFICYFYNIFNFFYYLFFKICYLNFYNYLFLNLNNKINLNLNYFKIDNFFFNYNFLNFIRNLDFFNFNDNTYNKISNDYNFFKYFFKINYNFLIQFNNLFSKDYINFSFNIKFINTFYNSDQLNNLNLNYNYNKDINTGLNLNYNFNIFYLFNLLYTNVFILIKNLFDWLIINIFANFNNNFIDLLFQYNFFKFNNFADLRINLNSNNLIETNNSILFKDSFLYKNLEFSNFKRSIRSDNPLFKYDDKAGSYFSDVHNKNFPHLWISFDQVTRGQRRNVWFLSSNFNELFFNYLNNYVKVLSLLNSFDIIKPNLSSYKYLLNSYYLSHSDIFFFFWLNIINNTNYINQRWLVLSNLNQKFYSLFLTQTLQQRIFNNWRQLKFTRESWRCRLLVSRHQQTLYRRYVNEDGLFWALERNARDLLPGWAMITPFSARTRFTAIGKTDIGLLGVGVVLVASMVSGVNFLITFRYLSTLNNRKMRDAKCFFTECILATNMMMICANPMLVIAIIMLLSDRHWNTSFFDYSGGGDTVLFQHMFWFFGHPEVYVIIVPTFGFTNTILSHYLRKRISARASLLYSIYTIAFLGFFVWGHHMYMVGLAHTTRMLYSTLTVMISVPAATKLMHWLVTLINSSWHYELPFIMAMMFIFLFTSGGISGMSVAHTGMDVLFHDTFFVVGHFHVMLAGSAMIGCFAGIYFYFPAIFGVKYNRPLAYLHVIYYLIGQLLTVIPMLWLGYGGMPRRVLDYPAALGGWHSMCSAGHMISVAAMIAFFFMLYNSMRQAKPAIRTTFGIGRYNTRLNFYLYEISRVRYIRHKGLFLNKPILNNLKKINDKVYLNFELYETTLYSYVFIKNK